MSLANQVRNIVKDSRTVKQPSDKLQQQQAYYERLVSNGVAEKTPYNIMPSHEAEKDRLVFAHLPS